MTQRRQWVVLALVAWLCWGGAFNALAQSSASVQGGNFDLPGLKETTERYEVFLTEGKFVVEITVSVDRTSDAEFVELRDEGFGGEVRAKIIRGTTKTVVLTSKLLALRPSQDRRAFGTYQVTVLNRASS